MIPFVAALNVIGAASSLLDTASDRRPGPAGTAADGQASPTSFASLLKSEGVDVGKNLHSALSALTGRAAGGSRVG